MRLSARTSLCALAAFAALPSAAFAAPRMTPLVSGAPSYTATMLPNPGGYLSGQATAINVHGFVVGEVVEPFRGLSASFVAASFNPPRVAPRGFGSHVSGVNASGETVGYYYTDQFESTAQPFAVQNGHVVVLQGNTARAYGVNDAGIIVGVATIASTPKPVFWTAANPRPQVIPGSIPSGSTVTAYAVNDNNIVAGDLISVGRVPAILLNGAWHSLGSLGTDFTHANAMNNHNVVVGDGIAPSGFSQAFVWDGTFHAIPPLAAGEDCGATSVNDAGDVVGDCTQNGEYPVTQAFLYHAGTLYNLASLVVGGPTFTDVLANGINNAGQIALTATTTAQPSGHVYVLNPVSSGAAVRGGVLH